MKKTPITNLDEKLDIIEHLNQDHTEELLVVADFYGKGGESYQEAFIKDIFEEGLLIEANGAEHKEEIYVPFSIKGSLEDKVLYLAYFALTKQGASLKSNRRKFFEVVGKSKPSKNMMRVFIRSVSPLPEYYAGYTYGIVLKLIKTLPTKESKSEEKKNFFQRAFDEFFIWMLRILNTKNRMKLVKTLNKDIRLYTLRRSEKDEQGLASLGCIDVFLHGDSPGGDWIRTLQKGDIIFSRTEVEDKHQHLKLGSNVLVADETAYPAAAGILELWSNPKPPTVIVLYADKAEISYFDHVQAPKGTVYHYVSYEGIEQAAPVLTVLKTLGQLDGAWGGLEREAAKEVRHYIRNELAVDGKKNHIKGYWALKEEKEE